MVAPVRWAARWTASARTLLGAGQGLAGRRRVDAVLEMIARYRLTHVRPGFGIETAVASRYPRQNVLQSGWLLGEEYLKDQANVVSFRVGKGYVVTYGTQIDFRAQPRATFKLLFNGIYSR